MFKKALFSTLLFTLVIVNLIIWPSMLNNSNDNKIVNGTEDVQSGQGNTSKNSGDLTGSEPELVNESTTPENDEPKRESGSEQNSESTAEETPFQVVDIK